MIFQHEWEPSSVLTPGQPTVLHSPLAHQPHACINHMNASVSHASTTWMQASTSPLDKQLCWCMGLSNQNVTTFILYLNLICKKLLSCDTPQLYLCWVEFSCVRMRSWRWLSGASTTWRAWQTMLLSIHRFWMLVVITCVCVCLFSWPVVITFCDFLLW